VCVCDQRRESEEEDFVPRELLSGDLLNLNIFKPVFTFLASCTYFHVFCVVIHRICCTECGT
jgi:hypothetical protein